MVFYMRSTYTFDLRSPTLLKLWYLKIIFLNRSHDWKANCQNRKKWPKMSQNHEYFRLKWLLNMFGDAFFMYLQILDHKKSKSQYTFWILGNMRQNRSIFMKNRSRNLKLLYLRNTFLLSTFSVAMKLKLGQVGKIGQKLYSWFWLSWAILSYWKIHGKGWFCHTRPISHVNFPRTERDFYIP